MPASRSVTFTGAIKDYDALTRVAVRAGRAVANLMFLPVMGLLSGWSFSTPSDLWWSLVFELGWARRHPLLVADKRLWLPADQPTNFIPYDLGKLTGLASTGLGPLKSIPANWLKRLPEAWVSELDDLAAASADAVDYLQNELMLDAQPADDSDASSAQDGVVDESEGDGMPIRRRFAVALSFPGEHRTLVKKVALALRKAFGETRVFYDHFHKEELSRPDLDFVLQRFYSEDADLVIVFVCGEYQTKEWCGLEWRAIRDLMKSHSRQKEDVMFLRLDDKPLEGLLSIDGYLDIAKKSPRAVADSIIKRWSATR
jgi:hypothetical protein